MYGKEPVIVGNFDIKCQEMMFYQDMPIKLIDDYVKHEKRLDIFYNIVQESCEDFVENFNYGKYMDSYIYIGAKHLFQPENQSYNRPGWHSDGFGSDDINYIWSNKFPTVFNTSKFNLSQCDKKSMQEMEEQALPENDIVYPEGSLLRLDQYNIHRVATNTPAGMRTFVKVTFSKNKFNLLGNTHNYLLDYDWEMKPRSLERNIPGENK